MGSLKLFSQRTKSEFKYLSFFVSLYKKRSLRMVVRITGKITDNQLLKVSNDDYPEFYEIIRQIVSYRPKFSFVDPKSPAIQFWTEIFRIILDEDSETIRFELRSFNVKMKSSSYNYEKEPCFNLMPNDVKIMKYILESTYSDEDGLTGFNMGDFIIFLKKEEIPF